MEFQGYKVTKNAKTGREMWFKDGRLTSVKNVPDNIKTYFSEEKRDKKPVDGSSLYGFTDGESTNDSEMTEKIKQEKAATDALENRFPEFEFKVEYTPGYNRDGLKIKPRYLIYVLVGGILEKTMRVSEFDLNVINENLKALMDDWESTGKKRSPRKGETLEEKLVVGTTEKTFVREVTVPKSRG